MNQFYRALHMPPARLFKKLTGSREIYTIAVRPRDPENPLPALGQGAYTPLPYDPNTWYADPLLCTWQGRQVLFCEAFDRAAERGAIAVTEVAPNGFPAPPRVVLREDYHLSFPMTFAWNGRLYMIPESGANHSLNLYVCRAFPDDWALAASFPVGCELCDTIVWAQTPEAVTLLASETRPENQLYSRWRRFTLSAGEAGFDLAPDDAFNCEYQTFSLASRNAGPLFDWGGQTVHPAQVSTSVDYGVYLQFLVCQPGKTGARPLCAAEPARVTIEGLDPRDFIGIHTYCCDDALEILDVRYLRKDPAAPVPARQEKFRFALPRPAAAPAGAANAAAPLPSPEKPSAPADRKE